MARKTKIPSASVKITSGLSSSFKSLTGPLSNDSALNPKNLITANTRLIRDISSALNPASLFGGITISDYTSPIAPKVFADIVSVFDTFTRDLGKRIAEIVVIDDTRIHFRSTKILSDAPTISDNAALLVSFIRAFDEDQSSFDTLQTLQFIKGIADVVVPAELLVAAVDKPLSDTQELADFYAMSVDYIRSYEDSIYDISDANIIDLTKVFNDYVIDTPDTNVFDVYKPFSEVIETPETFVFDFEKVFADYANPVDLIEVPDGETYELIKTLRNTISDISDDFSKVVSFVRQADEDMMSYELLPVFDFTKPLSDIFNISEQAAIDYTKIAYDTAFTSDTTSLDTTKAFSDEQSGQTETNVFSVIKSNSDSITASDSFSKLLAVFRDFTDTQTFADRPYLTNTKSASDSIETPSDNFNRILSAARSFTDSVTESDSRFNVFTKTRSDIAIPSDSIIVTLIFTRDFADIISSLSDSRSNVFTKSASDSIETPSDSFSRTLSAVRSFADIISSLSDNKALSAIKSLSDTYSGFTDSAALTPTKALSDSQSLSDAISTKSFTKSLSDEFYPIDEFSLSDGNLYSFTKGLSEDVHEPYDAFTYVWSATKSFTDSVTESDSRFNIFTKPLSDSITTPSDNFNRILSAARSFTDSVTESDNRSNAFTKSLSDSITTPSDNFSKTFSAVRSFTDLVTTPSDSRFNIFTKSLADSITTPSDSFNRTFTSSRSFTDSITESDSRSNVFTKPLSDSITTPSDSFNRILSAVRSFTDSISESDSKILSFTKGLSDLPVASDAKIYSFTKPLTDVQTVAEAKALAMAKALSDTQSGQTDRPYITTTKALADVYNSAAITEDLTFDLDISKTFFDTSTISDAITTRYFTKGLSDSVIALDNVGITDGSTYTEGKSLADINTTSDVISLSLSFLRSFADVIMTPADGPSYIDEDEYAYEYWPLDYLIEWRPLLSVTKVIADSVAAPTDYAVIVTLPVRKFYDYITSYVETIKFSGIKVLNDTPVFTDRPYLTLTKIGTGFRDYPVVSELLSNTVSKAGTNFTESAPATERIYNTLSKGTFTETQSLADKETNQVTKAFADIATAIDLITSLDGSTYGLDHVVPTTDSFITSVDARRATITKTGSGFTDTQSIAETITNKSVSLSKTDASTITERIYNALTKGTFTEFITETDGNYHAEEDYAIGYFDPTDGVVYAEYYVPSVFNTKVVIDSQTLSDNNTIQFTKPLTDSLASAPSDAITQKTTTLGKNETPTFTDTITTKTISVLYKDYALPQDLLTIADGGTYALYKSFSTDNVTESDAKAFTLTKPSLAETQSIADSRSSQFTKILQDAYNTSSVTETVVFLATKGLADSETPTEGITNKALTKPLTDSETPTEGITNKTATLAKNDTAVPSDAITQKTASVVYKDYPVPLEGPSYYGEEGFAIGYFDLTDGIIYTEIYDAIKSITKIGSGFIDSLSLSDFRSSIFTKPFTETLTSSEGITNKTLSLAKSESQSIADALTTRSFTKAIADIATISDILVFGDGSTSSFNKGLYDTLTTPADTKAFYLTKPSLADTYSGFTDSARLTPTKALADSSVGTWTDAISQKTFTKSLADYVVALEDLTPQLVPSDKNEFQPADDLTTTQFTKSLADVSNSPTDAITQKTTTLGKRDSVYEFEGPTYLDSNEYALNYLDPDYIWHFKIVYSMTKPLSDAQSLADASSRYITKGTFIETLTASEAKTYVATLVKSDSQSIADALTTRSFTKAIADIAYAQDLLTIPDGSTYSLNKSLQDLLLTPVADKAIVSFTKPLTDTQLGQTDAIVFAPTLAKTDTQSVAEVITNKTTSLAKADSESPTDAITNKSGIKALADALLSAPVDNITNKTATLVKADSQSLADNDTILFTKARTDTSTTSDGPSYYGEEGYAVDYFDLTDGLIYTEIYAAVLSFIKVTTDTIGQLEGITNKLFTKPLSDSQSLADSITNKATTKAFADIASAIDLVGVTDGGTYTFNQVLKDYQAQADLAKLTPTLAKADSATPANGTGTMINSNYVQSTFFATPADYVGTISTFTG
jgi:hypothetical protein